MSSGDTVTPTDQTTDVVGARVGAQVVDTVVLFVQLLAVSFLLGALFRPTSEAGLKGIVFLAFLSLPLYGTLFEGRWNGQTLGKRLVGIKVVDRQGNEPSLGQAFARNVPAVVLFSWLVIVVGLVAIATSDRRQRLFDQVADTYVVADAAGHGGRSHTSSGPSTRPGPRPPR